MSRPSMSKITASIILLYVNYYYSTVTDFARLGGLSMSLFNCFATSTENIQSGTNGMNGASVAETSGTVIVSV